EPVHGCFDIGTVLIMQPHHLALGLTHIQGARLDLSVARDDVLTGRTAMAAPVRNKEDIAAAVVKRGKLRLPPRLLLASVIPKHCRKWACTLRLVNEPM